MFEKKIKQQEIDEYKKKNNLTGEDPKISFFSEQETTVNGIHLKDTDHKKQSQKRKKMTLNEQRESVRKRRKKTGTTTLVYRNVKSNPDLVYLGLIVLSCLALGFFIAKILYGVTAKDVIGYMWELAQIIVAGAAVVAFVIAKIFTRAGPIAESCQSNGNKENTDKFGRTIIQ